MRWERIGDPSKSEWKEYLFSFEKRHGFPYTKKPRYLVDENLGQGVAQLLRDWDCNVRGVWELGLTGHPDKNIWSAAYKDRRILLTHDDDFLDNRRFPLKTSFGVIVLPHKAGEESLLVNKLGHVVSILSGGAGLIYQCKVVVSVDDQWRIISIDDTGALQERLLDLSESHHVYLLTNGSGGSV
jgi:predicted nuclease of predicted toxin-antitoxin system